MKTAGGAPLPEAYELHIEKLRQEIANRKLTPIPALVLEPSEKRCVVTGVYDEERKPFEVHVVSDIDGCVNIEELPEAERWKSISPAREAFAPVQRHGIMISLMSSRSLAEIHLYRCEVGLNGFAIGEDGGAIQLPESFSHSTLDALGKAGFRVETLAEMNIVNLSRISTQTLRSVLIEVAEESGLPVISSLTSTAEELQAAAGHQSIAHAEASMVRAASAYTKHLTEDQAALLHKKCRALNIRVMDCPWDSTHLLFGCTPNGEPVNKGDALLALNRIIAIAHGVAGMRPVVIGNGTNDLPLMKIAVKLGGQAIVIPKLDGTYALPIEEVPSTALRASKAAGEGIAEVLPWAVMLVKEAL